MYCLVPGTFVVESAENLTLEKPWVAYPSSDNT